MSSLRNCISRRAHKERAQPQSRKKFGLLEKHKDYVIRAKAFHQKEETIQKLKEKAAFRNPEEFYFKMIKTKTLNGVHQPESEANKYTQDELMLMKTQDIGYILQKVQSEKKKIEKHSSMLHSLDNQPTNKHVYYAEDRFEFPYCLQCRFKQTIIHSLTESFEQLVACGLLYESTWERGRETVKYGNLGNDMEFDQAFSALRLSLQETMINHHKWEEAREIKSRNLQREKLPASAEVIGGIKRKTTASYRELEERKKRVNDLERIYMDMALKKELQKKGKKRKLREDEIVSPTAKPVYKWRTERKR